MGATIAGLGRAFIRQEKTQVAIAVYQLGLEYHPNSASLYSGLANALEADNQLDMALESARSAVELAKRQDREDAGELELRVEELARAKRR
ncbi:MAG: tetratricopeptide (TPR) repeat protein [Rhodothermales bacterium]|jgi:tetratricopeptide (TPR) repeat protein